MQLADFNLTDLFNKWRTDQLTFYLILQIYFVKGHLKLLCLCLRVCLCKFTHVCSQDRTFFTQHFGDETGTFLSFVGECFEVHHSEGTRSFIWMVTDNCTIFKHAILMAYSS